MALNPEQRRKNLRMGIALLSVALVFGLSQVYFLFYVVIPTIRGGKPAEAKAWEGAEGLEWTVPSPAPFHTFDTQPIVK